MDRVGMYVIVQPGISRRLVEHRVRIEQRSQTRWTYLNYKNIFQNIIF